MGKAGGWGLILFLFFFAMGVLGFFASSSGNFDLTNMPGKKKVAIVNIIGSFSTKQSDEILKLMHRYREDNSIAAVVLRIDSGGGGVAAAQEMLAEVYKLKAAGKKIVVSMGEVTASGGYYVACAADKIFANPGTLTGSIGVIMEVPNLEGLFQKVGFKTQVVKSGEYKDIGSSGREMTPQEKQLIQGMIDDVYEQFVEAISKGRKIPVEQIKEFADGRVFSGRKALQLRLVDELGDLDDAVKSAGELSGIKGKPTVIKEEIKRGIFIPLPLDSWFGKVMDAAESGVRLSYLLK